MVRDMYAEEGAGRTEGNMNLVLVQAHGSSNILEGLEAQAFFGYNSSMKREFSASMKSDVTGIGETVVLVPGGLTGWLSWVPHAKELSKDNRVIRVQLLSVDLGLQNAPLPTGYCVDFETSALQNTLKQRGVTNADFVAWSYGAEVTLNFALHNPDMIRSLTLIEPPAIWVLRSAGPLSADVLEDQKNIKKLGTGEVTEDQLAWFSHFAGFVPANVNPRTLPQWPVWVQHRQSLRTGDIVFQHHDDIQRVRNFAKPVLLLKGIGSSKFLHDIIDILSQEFPNVRTETLPGGHAPQIVAKEQFMKILQDFLLSSRQ